MSEVVIKKTLLGRSIRVAGKHVGWLAKDSHGRFGIDIPGIYWRAGIPNKDKGGSGRSNHATLKDALATAKELHAMRWI